MSRLLFSLLVLLAIYLAGLASLAPGNIFTGLIISVLFLAVFRRFTNPNGLIRPIPNLLARIAAFFPFLIVTIWEILTGSWKVALAILRVQPVDQTGQVEIPIGTRSRLGVAMTGLRTTMTPGSALVEVDWDRGVMVFSYLNASNPDKIREKHRRFYEQYQRKVFP